MVQIDYMGREWSGAQLATIRIGDLATPTYQRELIKGHLARIDREFDRIEFDPPKVNVRDGVPYIFDGQHGTRIVRRRYGDDERITVRVYDLGSLRDEARHYVRINKSRRQLTPFNEYVAGRENAGAIEWAMALDTIMRRHRFDLVKSLSDRVPSDDVAVLGCAGVLRDALVEEAGRGPMTQEQIVDRTLAAMNEKWRGAGIMADGATDAVIVECIIAWLQTRPDDVAVEDIVLTLSRWAGPGLMRDAITRKRTAAGSNSQRKAGVAVLAQAYARRRRSKVA